MGRPTMRDPKHPHWPRAGERTHMREVAERWKWAYVDLSDARHLERTIGRREVPRLGPSIESYMEHRRHVVEPTTFRSERSVLRHLTDTFPAGKDVAAIELQPWVDSMLSQGYRASTLDSYLNSMRGLWKWLGLPFPTVRLPRPQKTDVRYWTEPEVDRLRKSAKAIEPAARLALDLTLFLGLRIGEAMAIQWEDVRRSEWSARVQRQLTTSSKAPTGLKGKRARTTLILPGWTHEGTEGYVVTRDGSLLTRRIARRWIDKILTDSGLNAMGAGWHMGRHTYARVCLEGGVSLEELRMFLGHSSIQTTQETYGHMRPGKATQSARRALLGGR